MALKTTGGSGTRNGYFLSFLDVMAASNVAKEPNNISIGPNPPSIFETKHPTNKPGIEAGIIAGRTVKASDNRN